MMKTYKGSVLPLLFFFSAFAAHAQTLTVYVAPHGAATGEGATVSAPVTLGRAKYITELYPTHPINIWLTPGIYNQLTLDAADNRSASAPVTYQAVTPGTAIFEPLSGLDVTAFTAIPASIQSRIIDATAKTKVKQLNLASYNFSDMTPWPSTFTIDALKSPKFYWNGYPMPMSRYPDTGSMTMRQVVNPGSGNSIPGGSFKARDMRAKYWQTAISDGGLFLCGNWQMPWVMNAIKTSSVSTVDSLITQAVGISGGLGTETNKIASGSEPYYAMNLVEEIHKEGQWAINFNTKTLYMWVPASGNITVDGNSSIPAISVTNVGYTSFINLGIRDGSGNGIELHNCNNILIAGTHIVDCSGNGIVITDGSKNTVQSNDIDSVGAGGIVVTTSNLLTDQYNMKLSGHQIINNHIWSYARESPLYSAAINVEVAMGAYVAYNKVHDAPHVGILYGGNNNTLEYNEVYDVVKKYTDMGAFYTWAGSNIWNNRGNKLHHNYIHDAPMANGIYDDNFASGNTSTYNIVTGVIMGLFNHEGYWNSYQNNICVQNTYPVTTSVEPSTDASYISSFAALKTIWNGSAAYKAAYPECADMVGSATVNKAYTSKIWPSIIGNVFIDNPGILSAVNDSKVFNTDGTTNATYATTDLPWTQNSCIFQNNFKYKGVLLQTISPFKIDSLRSVNAFGKSLGTDWHINRIGLHTDTYRTDISQTKTAGIDPAITLRVTSTNNFTNPQVITYTVGVKCPNAANILSTVGFYQYNTQIKGVTITKTANAYDSVTYTFHQTSPAPDPNAPNFQITFKGSDSTYWSYASNTVTFTVTVAAAAKTTLAIAADPASSVQNATGSSLNTGSSPNSSSATTATAANASNLQWNADNETNVDSYQVLESKDSVNFSPLTTVKAKCNDSTKCAYILPVRAAQDEKLYYQVQVITKDSLTSLTNIVSLENHSGGSLSLYPDPANTFINVDYTSPQQEGNASLVVYDLLGRILINRPVQVQQGLNHINLPLNNLSTGSYLLKFETPNRSVIVKHFIIRH